MRIMIVCPGRFSLGELHNAMLLAGQLRRAGMSPLLVVPPQNAAYARAAGVPVHEFAPRLTRQDAQLAAIAEEFGPDGVILADHHLLTLEPAPITLDGLRALGRPLAAVDSLALGAGVPGMAMEIARLPGAETMRRWYAPRIDIPPLPDDVTPLRPVPVAPPSKADGAFRLYDAPPVVDRDRALAVRAAHGVGEDGLLVVFPKSAWASTAFDYIAKATGSGCDHRGLFRTWLARILRRLERPVTVVGVGRGPVAAGPADDAVRFVNSAPLPLADFTELLGAADLFLTDNITSCAMARATLLGTPAVALLHEGGPSGPQEPADQAALDAFEEHLPGVLFPYAVFPYGWRAELAPLLTGNPFLDAVARAPVYHAAGAAERIGEVLAGAAGGHVPGRDALLTSMNRLPDGPQTVATWLHASR
ncbi:hypothetical protein I5Q34_23520 [Streptomyces sp. AV19]|uniref:DUF6365 family protein n=1 Tax=Streptomyces sp. AV19 TaxID=2793068 RepID=UPI0018FE7327|nr:DUF6365 family protein [Streptomyces sp. AV19]MBH1937200.1 hypothetical protein [Streptomyces sp. AV19]MDG4533473.1 DUF6365 family protein [Streptomyces sp. AV19]